MRSERGGSPPLPKTSFLICVGDSCQAADKRDKDSKTKVNQSEIGTEKMDAFVCVKYRVNTSLSAETEGVKKETKNKLSHHRPQPA